MNIFSKIIDFFIPAAQAESVRVDEIQEEYKLPDRNPNNNNGSYAGYRYEVYDKGKLVSVMDSRILEEEKKRKIYEAKLETQERILAVAPYYKQLNAANGLLDPREKDAIVKRIDKCKAWCDKKELDINKADTLDELDQINLKENI